MKKAETFVKRVTGLVAVVSYVGFFFIMALTICDVLIRYISGASILGVYEIVERVMICAVFASFAYTQTEHGHVQITKLVSMFPAKLRFLVMSLNSLISAAVIVLAAYAAWRQGNVALESNYTTGVLFIPLYPFYWVEIVSMAVFCLALLFDTVKNFFGIFNQEIAKEVQSTWS